MAAVCGMTTPIACVSRTRSLRPCAVACDRTNTLRISSIVGLGLALACNSADESATTSFGTVADDTGDGADAADVDTSTSTSANDASTAADDADASTTSGTSSSGTTGDGSETTGVPQESCPENGPPPGPAVNKFDVATLSCGMGQLECPAEDDQCFCSPHFAALNVGPPHFMSTGTDNNKELVWAAGNFQSAYVDDLNTDWPDGGQARADALMTAMEEAFDCGIPEWFIVNEISAGLWPDDASYRQFVIDFATAMDVDYDKSVIIAAPFSGPGNHPGDWAALADHAFVGAEVYLSGTAINAAGNSVNWCRDQYQAAVDDYAAVGVPLNRLVLVEHFGQTTPDKTWGRAGVSVAGWHNAIEARSAAAHQIDFAGYVSYAWSWNLMHETDDNRFDFMETYVQQVLP